MPFNYNDPTITRWEVDEQGQKISVPVVNEEKQIIGNKLTLEGFPDQARRVTIDGFVEIDINAKITDTNQFKVDYRKTGNVYFHPSRDGETVSINYYSRGLVYFPASRIWTIIEGDIVITLQQVVNSAEEALAVLEDLTGYTELAKGEIDIYVGGKKVILDDHTEDKKEEINTHTLAKETQLDTYADLKEQDLDAHTVLKEEQLDSHAESKETQLNDHTDVKKTELDEHTENKEEQLDAHTVELKTELTTHSTTRIEAITTHTNNKIGELDDHTDANKDELNDHTVTKKGELNVHTGEKKSELETVAAKTPYIGENGNWYIVDPITGNFIDSGESSIGRAITILGQLDNVSQLPSVGQSGDGYIIDGHLHVWTGTHWEDVGQIQGPEGPQGPQGDPGIYVGTSAPSPEEYSIWVDTN